MLTLEELIKGIKEPKEEARKAALLHWDALAKPLGSLGLLEEDITKIAALIGKEEVRLDQASLLVFCADNGVIAQGVSQSDESVTSAVAKALGEGTSTVNYMANAAGCKVCPVNIGMKEESALPGVIHIPVKKGTNDFSQGPAMSRAECEKALLAGAELVRKEKEAGAQIILLGEMGIGNTTSAAALSCLLLGESPERMCGRGAGLSDKGLQKKIKVIEKAIELNQPDRQEPIDLLSKVGGLDLAALTGACLGGAYYDIPIILDGLITCAAAVCALRLSDKCQKALLASHVSSEPAAELLLKELNLQAPIHAGLHLGEGTGAILAYELLKNVLAVYNSGHTFGHLGIDAYVPL
jgi:nicotinate-nucleotide--dimethylbenzimidazole phosphoribosyltransferase